MRRPATQAVLDRNEQNTRLLRRDLEYLATADVLELNDVTPDQVSEFLAVLREGAPGRPPLASSSAARALVAVRGLHKFAVREGVADSDPAREVKPPTPPRRLP